MQIKKLQILTRSNAKYLPLTYFITKVVWHCLQ